jgi:molybdopterin/thiamine biosynthesis adenylyltransferase/rhodanese-related sulfurtransferase
MTTFRELIRKVKTEIREVTAEEAQQAAQKGALLVDVREADEWAQGHAPGALHIPRGFLEIRIEESAKDKDAKVVLYCAGGTRSAFAARSLQELGYTDVVSLTGGFGRWKEAGLPVEVPKTLSSEQRQRYSRHLLVPEVGEAGQAKLLDSKVLLVGAGGLGCPAGLYLAAAGVGTLGIVDSDVVDLSNLQRQVLHTNARVGRLKTESAAETIHALNPDVNVVRHDLRLDFSNVMEVLRPYDLILDGSDNFSTKYLINDAAYFLGKPNVYGSIFRFEGQVTVFAPGQGPCYRCLFAEPPPAGLAPSCDEAGVLGVLPGVIGLLQATEAVKVLLGRGQPLIGRLLAYALGRDSPSSRRTRSALRLAARNPRSDRQDLAWCATDPAAPSEARPCSPGERECPCRFASVAAAAVHRRAKCRQVEGDGGRRSAPRAAQGAARRHATPRRLRSHVHLRQRRVTS